MKSRSSRPGGALIRMELHGAKRLEAALRELPKRIGKGALRRALMKAAEPVAEDARQRVAVRTGKVRDSIQVSTKLSKRQRRRMKVNPGDVFAFVGAGPSRRAHLIEFGTGPRQHRKSGVDATGRSRTPGKPTGQVRPEPFMRPAWDANKEQVLDDFANLLWIEIEKAALRIARRQARGTAGRR